VTIPVLMRVTLIERQTWLKIYWGSQTKEMKVKVSQPKVW
jgi:hypothetical protein